jgi:opacity protein-like surface antigen
MKNLLNIALLLCAPFLLQAQSTDKTLEDLTDKVKLTGLFGGINIYDEGHTHGRFGFEIANNFDLSFQAGSLEYRSSLSFGGYSKIDLRGIEFSYRPLEDRVFHPILSVSYNRAKTEDTYDSFNNIYFPNYKFNNLQTKIGMEVNVFRFLKLGLHGGLNIFEDLSESQILLNKDLPKYFGQISFKFGGFWE